MLKIAVLGGRETVMGFKALGLDVFPAAGADEARDILRRLARESDGQYAIIYVEENLVGKDKYTYFMGGNNPLYVIENPNAATDETLLVVRDQPSPAIILIPGREGPLGLGQSALKAAVEKAVGTDIL